MVGPSPARTGESATIQVPLNPLADEGARVTLALRRYAGQRHLLGSIVLNPGGPGASAVGLSGRFRRKQPGPAARSPL